MFMVVSVSQPKYVVKHALTYSICHPKVILKPIRIFVPKMDFKLSKSCPEKGILEMDIRFVRNVLVVLMPTTLKIY